jgi:hypothetical protein
MNGSKARKQLTTELSDAELWHPNHQKLYEKSKDAQPRSLQ